jgi:hypothetical protein
MRSRAVSLPRGIDTGLAAAGARLVAATFEFLQNIFHDPLPNIDAS